MLTTVQPNLPQLQAELATAGIVVEALGASGDPPAVDVYSYVDGDPVDLPPAAAPVLAAHVPPPAVVEFAGTVPVSAICRTTSATPLEILRVPCQTRHLYTATLTISGIDAGNGAIKVMEGRFVWKRPSTTAIVTGITVVSDLHDAAAAAWVPNCLPQGTDIVFTVTGAAGRVVDWLLVGEIGRFAPEGLS